MVQNEFELLLGNIVAQGLILRSLFTEAAVKTSHPRGSSKRTIDGLVASINSTNLQKSEDQARFKAIVEKALKEFGEQVDSQLKNAGYKS